MKTIRVEVTVTARVFVGEDVSEEKPTRAPDADIEIGGTRVAELGTFVGARDAVTSHFGGLLVGLAPATSERLRHQLREKGL